VLLSRPEPSPQNKTGDGFPSPAHTERKLSEALLHLI
jgi:hypothetical protein